MRVLILSFSGIILMTIALLFYQSGAVAQSPSRTTEPGPFVPTVVITRPGSPTHTPAPITVSYVYLPLIVRSP